MYILKVTKYIKLRIDIHNVLHNIIHVHSCRPIKYTFYKYYVGGESLHTILNYGSKCQRIFYQCQVADYLKVIHFLLKILRII